MPRNSGAVVPVLAEKLQLPDERDAGAAAMLGQGGRGPCVPRRDRETALPDAWWRSRIWRI